MTSTFKIHFVQVVRQHEPRPVDPPVDPYLRHIFSSRLYVLAPQAISPVASGDDGWVGEVFAEFSAGTECSPGEIGEKWKAHLVCLWKEAAHQTMAGKGRSTRFRVEEGARPKSSRWIIRSPVGDNAESASTPAVFRKILLFINIQDFWPRLSAIKLASGVLPSQRPPQHQPTFLLPVSVCAEFPSFTSG